MRRAQTGQGSDTMLSRYIRDGKVFVDNAAGEQWYLERLPNKLNRLRHCERSEAIQRAEIAG